MKSFVVLVVGLVGSMSVPLKAQDIPNIQRVDFSYGGDGFDAGEGFEMETGPDGTSFGFRGDDSVVEEIESGNGEDIPSELRKELEEETQANDDVEEDDEPVIIARDSDKSEVEDSSSQETDTNNESSDDSEEGEEPESKDDASPPPQEDAPLNLDEDPAELH